MTDRSPSRLACPVYHCVVETPQVYSFPSFGFTVGTAFQSLEQESTELEETRLPKLGWKHVAVTYCQHLRSNHPSQKRAKMPCATKMQQDLMVKA